MKSRKLDESKARLDRLIGKSRADLYKPIAIAEILFRDRVEKKIRLSEKEDYRRRSYEWMRDVISVLHRKTTQLNSRYWDQTFDQDVIPPETLVELGKANRKGDGVVECYVYWHVRNKFGGLGEIRRSLEDSRPGDFDLKSFLRKFQDDARFRRSVDKAYEIVVYALFNAVTKALDARVTLSVGSDRRQVLSDFEDFAKIVLGLDRKHPSLSLPARLFRVGVTNAADAGLDMWANFGPAVQVKHISLSASQTEDICDSVQADQVVVVCKTADAPAIRAVVSQIGLGGKLRGVITEDDLVRWYSLSCSAKYRDTVGISLLESIRHEMFLEFPLTEEKTVQKFFVERGYDDSMLTGLWSVEK